MGRADSGGVKLPRGVTIREFKTERRLQVAFSFQGVECRELLPPGPITQTSINHAAGLRAEIVRKIALGTFDYRSYFPDSERATRWASATKKVMVRELLDRQLHIYETQASAGNLAPSTLDGYTKAIRSRRMTFWDGVSLAEAGPAKLREFISSLDVTPKMARNLLTPLRSMFEDALNDELITVDPFSRIALSKLLGQVTKPSGYEVDPFTASERAALLESARADERTMLAFWFATGLRPGELMALRWPRVELEKRRVYIDTNLVAKVEKLPKTTAGIRYVDLDDQAVQAVQEQQRSVVRGIEHVWINPRTGVAWETDAQIRRTLWQPLLARAGVRHRNPYQVRHTYASSMLTAGANPWYVAQQLGHADVQMVFKVYGKFIREDYLRPRLSDATSAAGT